MTLAPEQTIELTVDRPAAGGAMIARHDGRVVLVTGAIPGERVAARIERVSKSLAFAHTVAVLASSDDRRAPFADPACGGCLYSHIAYPRQLSIKAQVIVDAFTRIGRLELPAAIHVAASPEDGYRMRARLHARGSRLGFFREGTHEVCDSRTSRQLLPETCDALDRVMAAARSLGADAVREVELAENLDASERVVHLETSRPLDPRALDAITRVEGLTAAPFVTDRLTVGESTIAMRRHVRAFFQGNRYLLGDLVSHVVDQVPRGVAVADLYAGAGLFGIAAAVSRHAQVVAVEGERFAADDLRANAAATGGRVTTIADRIESFAPASAVDVAIVDPPRTGMSPDAIDRTLGLGASRMIYVSCDPPTLARDARRIAEAGYRIERVDAFDLFPNTPHVETVVVFERR